MSVTLEDLNAHFEQLEKLAKAQELLASLRAHASPGAAALTGMPHTPSVTDRVGDLAIEIADLSSRVEHLHAEIKAEETGIAAFIEQIEDDQTRIIFRLRFLRGLSWKEVSQMLGPFTSENSVKAACYRFFRIDEDEPERDVTSCHAM